MAHLINMWDMSGAQCLECQKNLCCSFKEHWARIKEQKGNIWIKHGTLCHAASIACHYTQSLNITALFKNWFSHCRWMWGNNPSNFRLKCLCKNVVNWKWYVHWAIVRDVLMPCWFIHPWYFQGCTESYDVIQGTSVGIYCSLL